MRSVERGLGDVTISHARGTLFSGDFELGVPSCDFLTYIVDVVLLGVDHPEIIAVVNIISVRPVED